MAAETASDSLVYGPERAVLVARRRGSVLLDRGGPCPSCGGAGVNSEADRGVETLPLPPVTCSAGGAEAVRPMLGMLRRAVEHQAPRLLGRAATAGTVITQRHLSLEQELAA